MPLSTAYSVAETFGTESRLDDSFREARIFYGTYLGTMAVAAGIVLIPSVPLVPVLYLSQALNAILLVPLLIVLNRLSGDTQADGRAREYPCGQGACVVGNDLADRLRARTGIRLPHVKPGAAGDA